MHNKEIVATTIIKLSHSLQELVPFISVKLTVLKNCYVKWSENAGIKLALRTQICTDASKLFLLAEINKTNVTQIKQNKERESERVKYPKIVWESLYIFVIL